MWVCLQAGTTGTGLALLSSQTQLFSDASRNGVWLLLRDLLGLRGQQQLDGQRFGCLGLKHRAETEFSAPGSARRPSWSFGKCVWNASEHVTEQLHCCHLPLPHSYEVEMTLAQRSASSGTHVLGADLQQYTHGSGY